MSEESVEAAELIVVFHIFLFVLLAAFVRQIGQKLGLKFPSSISYLSGMLVGFYFIYFPDERIFVLDYLGPNVLRTFYTPLYFFIGTFKLETEYIQFRSVPHGVACALVWAGASFSVPFACIYHFNLSHDWFELVFMAIVIITPDLKTTKYFLEAMSHNFSSKEIFILLELECLIGSVIASLAHDLLVDKSHFHAIQLMSFILRNAFTCVFTFFVGKFTASTINRMHYDNLNQLTTVITALFLTYALAASFNSSGDLAAVTLGLVLLGAKPGMAPKTVNNVYRFIETFRFALVGSILIIGGILFTISIKLTITKKYLSISGTIYLIILSCRFVTITGFWAIFRKIYELKLIAILTICSVNIKSIFNLVLAFALITDIQKFSAEENELFVIANFQIFLSIVLTSPIASLMLSIEGQQTVNIEQFFMAQRALERVNECKETTIKVLKGIQFTVDADWSKVVQVASIEKGFFKRFAHRVNIKQFNFNTQFVDVTLMRSNAIKDLLRLQKRFFEEQFRHGTLGGRSAKRFAYLIRHCMHKSIFMSAQQVIDNTGPSVLLQTVIRDLLRALNTRKKSSTKRMLLLIPLLTFDVYLNVFTFLCRIFMFTNTPRLVTIFHMSYSLILGFVGFFLVLQTGSRYCHTIRYSLWNWLAWAFTFLSLATFAIDILFWNLNVSIHTRYYSIVRDLGLFMNAYYFLTVLVSILILLRSMILACSLHPVQYLLFRGASSMLYSCIHNQCDGCQGFLQVMVDTHQRLENRAIDPVFEAGASDILHQQSLAMRQFLGVMEILTPDVMTALKTRLACRLVLMSQEKIIHDLDEDGELETKEIDLLTETLREKLQYIRHLRTTLVEPSVSDIIKNVPWLAITGIPFRDIIDAGVIQNFGPGHVLLRQGEKVQGLNIVLRGLIRVEIATKINKFESPLLSKYRKSRYIIHQRESSVDQINLVDIELSDFYTRGNVIGEYPFLTDKPGHKTFRCVTDVKVLFLPKELLKSFIRNSIAGSIKMLEYNMWTTVAIRQAARLIQWSASYHLLTRRQLYIMMEDSYVMGSIEYGAVELEKLHRAAVVLIYGELSCPKTGETYQGPAILPSSLIHLYARRPETFQLYLEPSKNIILVLRSFRDMRLAKTHKPLIEAEASEMHLNDVGSVMTISSGSSDGIPYRHL